MKYSYLSYYEGSFKEGKKHGRGFYYYGNETAYEGEFYEDKKHGNGVYIDIFKQRFPVTYKCRAETKSVVVNPAVGEDYGPML
jgi:hypothetical protein